MGLQWKVYPAQAPPCLCCTAHNKPSEGPAAPLSTLWLCALLMLASAIKPAFLFPARPPTGGFTFAEKSREAEMEERLCAGVVLDLCLPVRGREWQLGVTHLITQADWGLFLASSGVLLKRNLYAVFDCRSCET